MVKLRNQQQISDLLYLHMKKKHVSKTDIARKCGITGSSANLSQGGARILKNLNIDALRQIAELLDEPIENLLFEGDGTLQIGTGNVTGNQNTVSIQQNSDEVDKFLKLPPDERKQVLEFLKYKKK